MVTIGESFRLGQSGHLWMVITTPEGVDGTFVMVNMTSVGPHTEDMTCVLHVGDHPEVHHDSVIRYGLAREWWNGGDRGHDYWSEFGQITACQPLDNIVLRRVQDGALISPFFKKKFVPRVQACLV
jgi:hypothetical protein